MSYVQQARENHVKKKVEEALRSKMKVKALKECDEYTKKYAECALGRTLSVVWKCRGQAKVLNNCLHQFILAGLAISLSLCSVTCVALLICFLANFNDTNINAEKVITYILS
ncbi:unnamed protein product [Trifolium pratense]|uniref:Uncharacterized protein n=1 Tax=Trifolium pratense TaxID=57577 RepID=A0ACB0LC75_TRIPR|nr:unnamed protein product [Trifolium pratense]